MKILNIVYNHDIFDYPYNQKFVKNTAKLLEDVLEKDVVVNVANTCSHSVAEFKQENDYIVAEYNFVIDDSTKRKLADILHASVTKVKKATPTDVMIAFRQTKENDLFLYHDGE